MYESELFTLNPNTSKSDVIYITVVPNGDNSGTEFLIDYQELNCGPEYEEHIKNISNYMVKTASRSYDQLLRFTNKRLPVTQLCNKKRSISVLEKMTNIYTKRFKESVRYL